MAEEKDPKENDAAENDAAESDAAESDAAESDAAESDVAENDPSMDEVLSSIRRILSEDEQEEGGSGAESNSGSGAEPKQGGSTELESEVVGAVTETDSISEEQKIDQASVTESPSPSTPAETDLGGILELTQQMIAQPPPAVGAGEHIISGTAQEASTDALQELAKALLSRRDIAIGSRDMTLEGLIREILRPLLREWLDENLPYLIERLVKKEIDHMVNRAERLDL